MTDKQIAKLQLIVNALNEAISLFAGQHEEKILRHVQNELIGLLYPLQPPTGPQ